MTQAGLHIGPPPNDLGVWKAHDYELGYTLAAVAAGTYAGNTLSTGNIGSAVTYIDPAQFAATGKTVQFRLLTDLLTNAVAPATDFTLNLFPVTASAGAAGVISVTLGATAGAAPVVSAPALGTQNHSESNPFTLTAGYYIFGLVVAGAMTASSAVAGRHRLQYRQV